MYCISFSSCDFRGFNCLVSKYSVYKSFQADICSNLYFKKKENISSKAVISSFPTLSFLLFSAKPYLDWLLNNSPRRLTSLPIAHFILIDHFHFFMHVKNALSFLYFVFTEIVCYQLCALFSQYVQISAKT